MAQQILLPIIPRGATEINAIVSVWRDDGRWTYFLGTHPIYTHHPENQRMFRFVTSQLIESGCCRHVEIINTFGVSKSSVNRALKRLREEGQEAFFKPRQGHRGGSVFTKEVIEQAQSFLNQGYSRSDIAEELSIRRDTLRKAIKDGRLQEQDRDCQENNATTKSSRDIEDAEAAEGMGTACTRVIERTFAAFGDNDGASVKFEPCLDVPMGGVLCTVPALLMNGLLNGCEQFLGEVKGYYRTFHILLLLAFMALSRIKTVEQLRGHSPGEFGNILGLDRVPEVRCLRKKMDALSADNAAEQWAAHLSTHWMQADPDAAGTLYIDGHVRVYHGKLTKLPRRFVSRDRLCLRGTTDYWINDAIGQPYFVVEKAINPGLLKTLQNDIVPRLLKDIPNQPSKQELKDNPYQCRFVMVFDREGYSPDFFREMWRKHRIGCITYHKHPDKDWPIEMFTEQVVTMPNGEVINIKLAEMGSLVGSGKKPIWMREIRKLTDSGHQTSLISTAYELSHIQLAARMFSRWCQENFFRYMMRHFSIDLVQEYGVEEFSGTEKVINPVWRELDRARNSMQNKLRYRRARFTEMTMHPETEAVQNKYIKWLEKKAALLEDIEHFEQKLKGVKLKLKGTPKHITWGQLEKKDKFNRLLPGRKQLMDTIRMIAYRAETTMSTLLTGPTVDTAKARQLLIDLFTTEADILPDKNNNLLLVRVHGASRPAANLSLKKLFAQLNESETFYPGTDMKIKYELGGGVKGNFGNGVIPIS